MTARVKACSVCGRELTLNHFYKRSNGTPQSWCRNCRAAHAKAQLRAKRQRCAGLVSAAVAAAQVGVNAATLRKWALHGLVPSVIREGCRVARWYDMAAVRAALEGGERRDLVPASAIARRCGFDYKAVMAMAKAGRVPSIVVDGVRMFRKDEAVVAVLRSQQERECARCRRFLPLEQFRTRKHKSGKAGPTSDCNDCHKAYNRKLRERDASAKGRTCRKRIEMSLPGTLSVTAAEKAGLIGHRLRKAITKGKVTAGIVCVLGMPRIRDVAAARQQWAEHLRAKRDAWRAARKHRAAASELHCRGCEKECARDQFYPTELGLCKQCVHKRDAARFQWDKENLTDAYIKRQLTKYSMLRAANIPPALIEVKRAQLKLKRLILRKEGHT